MRLTALILISLCLMGSIASAAEKSSGKYSFRAICSRLLNFAKSGVGSRVSEANSFEWISAEAALPEDGQAVIAYRKPTDWMFSHIWADGSRQAVWHLQTERFRSAPLDSYNFKPYMWGAQPGQDVSHWLPVPPATSKLWTNVRMALPRDLQPVLIMRKNSGIHEAHVLSDGSASEEWLWEAAVLSRHTGRATWESYGNPSLEVNDVVKWMAIPERSVSAAALPHTVLPQLTYNPESEPEKVAPPFPRRSELPQHIQRVEEELKAVRAVTNAILSKPPSLPANGRASE